jgi:hypothetical protein
MDVHIVKMYKDRVSTKRSKLFFYQWKITQIIDESVAISLEDQFNNYIHVHCENPHDKVLRSLFIYSMEEPSLEIQCS